MNREYRLRSSTDFKRVRLHGKSYAHPLFVLIALSNLNGTVRIGVAAGRSIGGAVERNRAKRRLRAAIAPLIINILPGWDLVLLARAAMREAEFTRIQYGVRAALLRAGLLTREGNISDDRP